MPYYTDNRFDDGHATAYCAAKPIGPGGRTVHFWASTKALPGYPGWHFLTMHADRYDSMECSTRDVIGTIAEMQAAWELDLTARYGASA